MKINLNSTTNSKIFLLFKFIGNLFLLLYAKFIQLKPCYKILFFGLIFYSAIFIDRYDILFSDELYHVNLKVIDKFELRDNYGNESIKLKVELPQYHNIIKMIDVAKIDEEKLHTKIGEIYSKDMTKAEIYNSWFYSDIINFMLVISFVLFLFAILISPPSF